MNIKALIKSLRLRKFATGLLLLQLSLTIGLMVNTVILTSSAMDKLNNPLRFDVESLVSIDLVPTSGAFRDPDYYRSITQQDIAKISALEGVISAAHYNQLPIQRGGWNGNLQPADFPDDGVLPKYLNYVPQFFSSEIGLENLGVEIVAGRALTQSDDVTNDFYHGNRDEIEQNIIVTESLAKAVFPDKPALGELTNNGRIVGIAKDFVVSPTHPGDTQFYAMFGNFMYSKADYTQHYIIKVKPGFVEQVQSQLAATILAVQPERDIVLVQSMSDRLSEFFVKDTGLASLFGV